MKNFTNFIGNCNFRQIALHDLYLPIKLVNQIILPSMVQGRLNPISCNVMWQKF